LQKKFKVGYTTGVYDMFHIGHLNILQKAKELCEYLIVAVSTDELVQKYKQKTPVIPFAERQAIVAAIKYVDEVVPQVDRDKIAAFERYRFEAMFVGADWQGSEVFAKVDAYMRERGGRVVYLPYTPNVSSTFLRAVLEHVYQENQEREACFLSGTGIGFAIK
jgi:glycerol-3-phosphate cytidylyltransferase